jgi:hypothetical protein
VAVSEAPLQREYNLLIQEAGAASVLLLPEAGGWALPRFLSPDRDLISGVAPRAWTREALGADVTLLRAFAAEIDPATDRWLRACLAVENHTPGWRPPAAARWADRAALAALPLARPADRTILDAWLGELAEGPPPARAAWARPGWFAQAVAWMRATLAAQGRALSGPVTQVKTWAISSLLRAPTAEGDVYLKACPTLPLFANEPAITAWLAARDSAVPRPLAVDPGRRWMLMDGFGPDLLKDAPLAAWHATVDAHGALQRALAPRTGALLAAGCLDRRLATLPAAIPGLLAFAAETEALPPADLARLRERAADVPALCAQLAGCGIPETLVHGDLHEHNVALAPGRPLIFDWSDSCLAHPFFDLITLLDTDHFAGEPQALADLRARYLAGWSAFGDEASRATALDLALRVGCLHHAISYQHIVMAVEPAARWEYMSGARFFLRALLAALAPPPA